MKGAEAMSELRSGVKMLLLGNDRKDGDSPGKDLREGEEDMYTRGDLRDSQCHRGMKGRRG